MTLVYGIRHTQYLYYELRYNGTQDNYNDTQILPHSAFDFMFILVSVLALASATFAAAIVTTGTDASRVKTGAKEKNGQKKDNSDWFRICKLYVDEYEGKMKYNIFLKSNQTGNK